jgi:hypothetical protein
MRKKIFKFFLKLFGFKKNPLIEPKKGTLIVLIDGLSYDALITAIKKGSCPTLKKLTQNGYVANKYYCGLPAATTATEALLFYGNKSNIPGFTWYDRELGMFVRGNRSYELSKFEDGYFKKRNLLKDGSAIMSVYTGGATQLSVSGRNLAFSRSLYFIKSAHYFFMALLYPVQLARTIFLTLKTLISYKKSNRHKFTETFSTIILGQFSCFLTEIEIMRNTKKIFVDFLLYDEFAHEYGPTHKTTLATLRLVDRYIRRIIRTTKSSDRPYDIVILSDHGQTQSIPYDKKYNRCIFDIQNALNDDSYTAIKTFGGFIPRHNKEIYVVPAGSTLQLYFSSHLKDGLMEHDINTLFPGFIERLLHMRAFGWILVKTSKSTATLYGKNGQVHFSQDKPAVLKGMPFTQLKQHEIDRTVRSFQSYALFPNNGDLTIFGDVSLDQEIYAFEKNHGNHGGFYGPMVYPFILTKNPEIKGDSMEELFDTIEASL